MDGSTALSFVFGAIYAVVVFSLAPIVARWIAYGFRPSFFVRSPEKLDVVDGQWRVVDSTLIDKPHARLALPLSTNKEATK